MSAASQSLAPTTTAASLTWNEYYATLFVENNSGATIFVRADGTSASSTGTTSGQVAVANGQTLTTPNPLGLPQPNLNAAQTATNFDGGPPGGGSFGGFNESSIAAPSFTTRDQSESWGWNTQTAYQGTSYTEISIVAVSGSSPNGDVIVTPQ